MKRNLLLTIILLVEVAVWAQGPNGTKDYYKSANGKKGYALKTALYNIIKAPGVKSYKSLDEWYLKTDNKGDGHIRDRYSNKTNYTLANMNTGDNSVEGGQLNKEHSFPKSWFHNATPMLSDLYHVVPSDAKVNNARSNFPFGENKGETFTSNGGYSKVGLCTFPGYKGKCFEPNDEWKGDFARIYFYMVTCYEYTVKTWDSAMLDGTDDHCFSDWALEMLLRWSKNDPVSQIEVDRNAAVEAIQDNRNPFVDYPGLEEYIWGDKTNVAFNYEDYNGVEPEPADPDNPDTPDDPDDPQPTDPDHPLTPVDGELLFAKVTSTADLEPGKGYLVVYEADGKALAESSTEYSEYRKIADVTITDGQILTKVDEAGTPRQLILGGTAGAYTFYDAVENVYLAYTGPKNNLNASETATDAAAQWTVSFSGGDASIRNNGDTERIIYYNASAPRFACYSSSPQQPVALYKAQLTDTPDDPVPTMLERVEAFTGMPVAIYTMDGRRMNGSLDTLPRGAYILRVGNRTTKVVK